MSFIRGDSLVFYWLIGLSFTLRGDCEKGIELKMFNNGEHSAWLLKVSVHGRTEEGILGGPGRTALGPMSCFVEQSRLCATTY